MIKMRLTFVDTEEGNIELNNSLNKIQDVNVNIFLYKKWKIIMYNN